jgi:predicted NUDIX family NTP pyrophosphohydrolase
MLIKERPTFYYNNDLTKPIRAGGVLLYKKNNNKLQILLIKKECFFKKNQCYDIYEDIGGKTDVFDKNILETITREVEEETNNIIKISFDNSESFYISHGKYLLYLIEANENIQNYNSTHFGNKEIHDNIDRTINWFDIEDYTKNKLRFNPRLVSNELKEYILNMSKPS